MDNSITYKNEIFRKGIHLCSLAIPLIYLFISKELALLIIIPLTVIMIISDLLSRRIKFLEKLIFGVFGNLLREHEKEGKLVLNGASWVLISASLCIAVYPKIIMVIAFTILIISDTLAALIGRRYGKSKLFDKSWEGTAAFIISAIAVVFMYSFSFNAPITLYIFGILGAIFGGFVEAASTKLKMDDNFSIPISVGSILWLGGYYAEIIKLPYLNLLN